MTEKDHFQAEQMRRLSLMEEKLNHLMAAADEMKAIGRMRLQQEAELLQEIREIRAERDDGDWWKDGGDDYPDYDG